MRVREDGGDAGAGDPAAFGRLWFVAPPSRDRPQPGHVRDGVLCSGRQAADANAVLAQARPRADGGVVTGASLARYARPVALGILLVWTEAHRLHDVREDTWAGVSLPADEVPERAEVIRDALAEAGVREVEAQGHPDDAASPSTRPSSCASWPARGGLGARRHARRSGARPRRRVHLPHARARRRPRTPRRRRCRRERASTASTRRPRSGAAPGEPHALRSTARSPQPISCLPASRRRTRAAVHQGTT